MNKKLMWLVFALAMTARAAAPDSATNATPLPELKPAVQQAQAAHMSSQILSRFHYKAIPLDDGLSEAIFDSYLKQLDSERIFFVQSDVDQWASLRTRFDDAILNENLSLPFSIFNRYAQRVSDRFAYARRLLKDGFDFQQQESYQYSREKEVWPTSEAEVRELWRKRVKNDWLRLKLAGKDDKSIVDMLDKRYEHSQKRVTQIKSEDAFQIFMNAYTMAIEPHTNYMGLRAAEDFEISMRLSLFGIGAVLSEKNEYTTIRELVPGGPAALSGQLKVGDRILGVGQGEKGEIADVLGWRLDDTVALIRGAADSTVVLDVLPAEANPDGKHQRVALVRKKITLEAQSAKKSVITVADGSVTRRIGVITLPSFYQDFDARQKSDPAYKSATRDVARLLDELKQENVDSVLIDLRNNGGGSLNEAVELTGLFIDKGPVVQQRSAQGKISLESDTKAGVAWNGPLGVLINRGSASASEIFAAAIQDYGRGLIIGEKSFGKGTVQTMIDLDQLAKNDKPKFGELKLTIAQFFRINGGTTQLRGVTPDILFPTISDDEDFGESSFDNALPWAQIKAADYAPVGNLSQLVPNLLNRRGIRVKTDKDYQYLLEDVAEFKQLRKKNQISLNEAERRKERDVQEAKLKARKTGQEAPDDLASSRDDGLQADERNLSNDLTAEKARKDAKDVLLNEAVHVLSDEVDILNSGTRLTRKIANTSKPVSASVAD